MTETFRLSDLRFVDIEASGLHKGSYPIEFGYCSLDLNPHSFLVRPHETWGLDNWSLASEKIHGIPRERLFDEGISLEEAAERLADDTEHRQCISDNPDYEQYWTDRLFQTLHLKSPISYRHYLSFKSSFDDLLIAKMPDITEAERDRMIDAVEKRYPHTHNAGDDAVRIAAHCRICVDADFRQSLLAGEETR